MLPILFIYALVAGFWILAPALDANKGLSRGVVERVIRRLLVVIIGTVALLAVLIGALILLVRWIC